MAHRTYNIVGDSVTGSRSVGDETGESDAMHSQVSMSWILHVYASTYVLFVPLQRFFSFSRIITAAAVNHLDFLTVAEVG